MMNDNDDGFSSLTVLVLSDLGGNDHKLTLLLTELIKSKQLVDCIFVTGSLTDGDPRLFNDSEYISTLLVKYKTVLQTLRQISSLVYFVQGANDPILTIRKLLSYTQTESTMLMKYPDNNEWTIDVSYQAVRLAPTLVIVGSSGSSASLDSYTKEAFNNGDDILWSDSVERELAETNKKKEVTLSSSFTSTPSMSLLNRLLNFEQHSTLFSVLQAALMELNVMEASPDLLMQSMTINNSTQSALKDIDPRILYTARTRDEICELIKYKHTTMDSPIKYKTVPHDNCGMCNTCCKYYNQKQSQYPPYPFGPFFYPYVLYEGLENFNSYTADGLTLASKYACSFNSYILHMSANRNSFLHYSQKSANLLTNKILSQIYEPQIDTHSCPITVSNQIAQSIRPIFAVDMDATVSTIKNINLSLDYSLEQLQPHTAFHDEPMAIFIKFLLDPGLLCPTETTYMVSHGQLFCYNIGTLSGTTYQNLQASASSSLASTGTDHVDCADHIMLSTEIYASDDIEITTQPASINSIMDEMLKNEWTMKHSVVAIRDGASHDLHDLYNARCNIMDEYSSLSDTSADGVSTYIRSMSTRYARSQSNASSTTNSLASSFVDDSTTGSIELNPLTQTMTPYSPTLAPLTPLMKLNTDPVSYNTIQNYKSYLKPNGSKVFSQDSPTYLTKPLQVLSGISNVSLIHEDSQDKVEGMRGWLRLSPTLYDRLPKSWTDWCNLMNSTNKNLSRLYSFNASKDSVIFLTHQGPAGSPTSYEFNKDKAELLETGSYSLRDLYCANLNLLLHVHGRARKPLTRLYELDDVIVFNPGTFCDGFYGILELKKKAGIWQVSSASVHKLSTDTQNT